MKLVGLDRGFAVAMFRQIFSFISVLSFASNSWALFNLEDFKSQVDRNVSRDARCGNGELLRPSYYEVGNILQKRSSDNSEAKLNDPEKWTAANWNWVCFDALVSRLLVPKSISVFSEAVDDVSAELCSKFEDRKYSAKIEAANKDVKRYLEFKDGFLRKFLDGLKPSDWHDAKIQEYGADQAGDTRLFTIEKTSPEFLRDENLRVPQVHASKFGDSAKDFGFLNFVASVKPSKELKYQLQSLLNTKELSDEFLISAPINPDDNDYYCDLTEDEDNKNQELALNLQWVFLDDSLGEEGRLKVASCDVICNVAVFSANGEIKKNGNKSFGAKKEVAFYPDGKTNQKLDIPDAPYELGFSYDDILKKNGNKIVFYNVQYFSNKNSGKVAKSLNGKSITGAIFVLNQEARRKFYNGCKKAKNSFAQILRILLEQDFISKAAYDLLVS